MILTVVLILAALLQSERAADPFEAVFRHAAQALQQGDLAAAERGFQRVLKTQPSNIGALANLGVTYSRMDRTVDAIDAYRRALKLAPNEPGLLLNLGLAHLKQGDYSAAKPLFARVEQSKAASAQSHQLLATCELFTGSPQRALELISSLPRSPETLFITGAANLKLKNQDAAKAAFQELLTSSIAPAQAHLLFGRAYLESNMFDEALAELNQADAASNAVKLEKAKTYIALRNNDAAESELRAILKAEPRNADAAYYLGALLVLISHEDEARPLLDIARAARPQGWGAYYYLGRASVQQKQQAKAIPLLEKAGQLNPQEAAVWFQLARAYQMAGRPNDTRKSLERYNQLREQSLEQAQQVLSPTR